MRKFLLACILLLMLWVVSAEWAERLRVQVIDNYMNPISNCLIEVNYQKHLTTGLDGKVSGRTNGDGIFEVELHNYVSENTGLENRVYTIKMSNPYGFKDQTRKVKYGDNPIEGVHLEQFNLNTTAARLRVIVTDQKGNPVDNATVSFGKEINSTTDKNGVASFGLPLRNYTVNVFKYGFTAEKKIGLTKEMEVQISMVIYENRLKVLVTNEYGIPIEGVNLSFNEVQLKTNSSGEAEFLRIRNATGILTAKYLGMERNVNVRFYEDTVSKTVVFPSKPLVIEPISTEIRSPDLENCTIFLSCRARDERVALSKITVAILYSVNGGNWNSIEQKNELGLFEFEIPCSPPSEISYKFSASDEYGSAETGIYNLTIQAPPECQENQTQQCTTSKDCPGFRPCVSGSWGNCLDIADDDCPASIKANETKPKDSEFKIPFITLPEGLGVAGVALVLLGSLTVIGLLGILVLTQRQKLGAVFKGVKDRISALRHVDEVIERADREYKREKLPESYMKDGKTDEFFGLDEKGDKGKKPPPQ